MVHSHTPQTRGVVFIHDCPRALTKHVEWAIAGVLAFPVTLEWSAQTCAPSHVRAALTWRGAIGTAATLMSQLRHWPLRIEITEEPTAIGPGQRFASTPTLGLFAAEIGPYGDVVLNENRLRALMSARAHEPWRLAADLEMALGGPWDDELEPFRASAEHIGASASSRQVM